MNPPHLLHCTGLGVAVRSHLRVAALLAALGSGIVPGSAAEPSVNWSIGWDGLVVLGRWTPSPAERQKIAAALETAVDEVAWGHVTPIQHLYGHGPG